MSSFTDIISAIEAVFSTSTWTSNSVVAYPSNYNPNDDYPNEFVKLEVLPTTPVDEQYGNAKQLKGLIIVQIYTPINGGIRRTAAIADMLDELLHRKSLGEGIATQSRSLQMKGTDADNPDLYRADYQVNFFSL